MNYASFDFLLFIFFASAALSVLVCVMLHLSWECHRISFNRTQHTKYTNSKLPSLRRVGRWKTTAAKSSTLIMTMRMAWMVTAETRVMKLTRIDPHAPQAPSAHHRGTAAPTMLQCCCYSLFFSPGRTNATLKNATTFTITSNAARSTS